jgi:Raf kinase inhibitor-like YbhB/YbcL family protein
MDELELTSPAFEHGRSIPRKHTCEGEDVSPPLAWSGVPQGTASLALVVDDPDAPGGTFTHWRAWGIDPTGLASAKVRCRLSRAERLRLGGVARPLSTPRPWTTPLRFSVARPRR